MQLRWPSKGPLPLISTLAPPSSFPCTFPRYFSSSLHNSFPHTKFPPLTHFWAHPTILSPGPEIPQSLPSLSKAYHLCPAFPLAVQDEEPDMGKIPENTLNINEITMYCSAQKQSKDVSLQDPQHTHTHKCLQPIYLSCPEMY